MHLVRTIFALLILNNKTRITANINTIFNYLSKMSVRIGSNQSVQNSSMMFSSKFKLPAPDSYEYKSLFGLENSNLISEFDESSNTLDYFTKNRNSLKIHEKTFSIKPIENERFVVASATYYGKLIKNSFLIELQGSTSLGKRPREYTLPIGNAIEISKLRDMFFNSKISDSDYISSENQKTLPPFLISIEGNIGAGKSTLLDALKKSHPDWHFIDEPVDTWTSLKNDEGESLLEIFYKDKKRWSYTFQNCALLSRFNLIESAVSQFNTPDTGSLKRKVFITERCLDTDDQVFAKMLRADGSLNSLEHELYRKWFQLLKETAFATALSAIIYVDTDPETCYKRISKRGRHGEDGIPIEYLASLDKFQSTWINNTKVPVIKVGSFPKVEDVNSFVEKELTKLREIDVKDLNENLNTKFPKTNEMSKQIQNKENFVDEILHQ